MNNKRETKRALLTSIMALVMCVVMLVGTTFAWFTDTASTGVNKIQAGNLDIEVEYRTTADSVWKTLDNADDLFGAEGTLFEPGHTRVVELKIKNAGNLALKYKIGMNVVSETEGTNKDDDPYKLSNYLKVATTGIQQYNPADQISSLMERLIFQKGDFGMWTARDFANFELEYTSNGSVHVLQPGAAQILGIKVYMPETVGNEANAISTEKAASIEFGLNILATQYTTESDSFGTQYDKDATYPVVDAADLAASVADLATEGNKNVVVSIAKDMNNIAGIKTAKGNTLTMDLNGKSVGVSYGQGSTNTTTNGMQLLQGSTVTLKNGTYKANHGNDAEHNIAILIQNYSNLTIEDCTLDMRDANDSAGNSARTTYALSTNCGKVVIKGDTNITARTDNNGNKEYALDVMHWENTGYEAEGTSVTFDETMTGTVDGKIDVYCYRNGNVVKPVIDGGATLTIMGGTFKNSGLTLEQFKAFVPAGYTVTTNADGSFTVSK